MRRKDKALSENDVLKILQDGEYGVLATVSEDGQPYGVPLSYIFEADNIYFHCALVGHKLENIESNARVSFTVVGRTEVIPSEFSTGFESVIAFGVATVITGNERYQALMGLAKKYSPDFVGDAPAYIEKFDKQTAVVRIKIEQITGKAKITENMK